MCPHEQSIEALLLIKQSFLKALLTHQTSIATGEQNFIITFIIS